MEKIQAAIQKARLARESGQREGFARPPLAAPPEPDGFPSAPDQDSDRDSEQALVKVTARNSGQPPAGDHAGDHARDPVRDDAGPREPAPIPGRPIAPGGSAAPARDAGEHRRPAAASGNDSRPAAAPREHRPAAAPGEPRPAAAERSAPVAAAPGRAPLLPEPPPAEIAARWEALPELRVSARHLVRNRVVALEGGAGATEISILRTRLLQQMRTNGWRRVAITSPGPSCGKTTLALNLGFALSRQPEQRTIVFETDFRRPTMARTLNLRERHSFAKVLGGESRFEDNVLRHGTNLAFATTSGAVSDPAELLQGRDSARILEEIEARYRPTAMIFDLPPMQSCDDVMAFVDRMDCVLLVAAAGSTTVAQIDACERDLSSQTGILGVVLNKCRYLQRSDSYDY